MEIESCSARMVEGNGKAEVVAECAGRGPRSRQGVQWDMDERMAGSETGGAK